MKYSLFKSISLVFTFVATCLSIQAFDTSSTGNSNDAVLKTNFSSMRSILLNDLVDPAAATPQRSLQINKQFPQQIVLKRLNASFYSTSSQMRLVKSKTDALGITHLRFQQYFQDIEVLNGIVIVHLRNDSVITAVTGYWAPNMQISITPKITETNALQRVQETLRIPLSSQPICKPRLIIVDGKLAWEFYVRRQDPESIVIRSFINASTGEYIGGLNQILPTGPSNKGEHTNIDGIRLTSEDGSTVNMQGWKDDTENGHYFMYNKLKKWTVFNQKTNDWEQRPTASWHGTDSAAVSLGYNLSMIQNWVRDTLQRNSYDDNGSYVNTFVHEGYNYVNAYWDPLLHELHFGDGDYTTASPLTVLDIVAHEYMHAITQFSSDLVYSYESGALNESFSDIFGTIIEFSTQPDGSDAYPLGLNGKSDWLCGEDSWLESEALRDLRNPQRFNQPSFYKGKLWYSGMDDNGGVHTNSGVQNFAFYLLSQGGTGINDEQNYSINGIGIQKAAHIALYANINLLTPSAQYRDCRDAWLLAASFLGYDTLVVRDVWTAVGIPPLEKHLVVTPDSLNFGPIGVGVTDTMWIELSNKGGVAVHVFAIHINDSCFAVKQKLPMKILPVSTVKVPILFTPNEYNTQFQAEISFVNDGLDNPKIPVKVLGSGTNPAKLDVSHSSIYRMVTYGDSSRCSLRIVNTGSAALNIFADIGTVKKSDGIPALIAAPASSNNTKNTGWEFMAKKPNTHLKSSANPQKLFNTSNLKIIYLSTILTNTTVLDSFSKGLQNLSNVSLVDFVQADLVTPTVEYLQKYDIAVVSSNSSFADPKLLGDVLADFVDNGGKVVLLVASIAQGGDYALSGRISTEDYMPIEMAGPGMACSQTVFENHPITTDLTYLSTLLPTDAQAVQKNGMSLGTYSNGALIGAVHLSKPVVAINVFPMDRCWEGDLIKMMGNTFDWLKKNLWLTVEPRRIPLKIAAGDTALFSITMSATNVYGGMYTSALSFTHNDPLNGNPLIIPCTLVVIGQKLLTTEIQSIDFGTVWTDRTKKMECILFNPGSEKTTISEIRSDNECFVLDMKAPVSIEPQKSKTVEVVFNPKKAGEYTAVLTISSDAEKYSPITISLSGSGVNPPIISHSPRSISVSLEPNSIEKKTVVFTNSGEADYSFNSKVVGYSIPTKPRLFASFGSAIMELNPNNGTITGQSLFLDSTWQGYVPAIAWDGEYLYCLKSTNEMFAFDIETGKQERKISLPDYYFPGVAVTDKYIIAASNYLKECLVLDKNNAEIVLRWRLAENLNFNGGIAFNGTHNSVYISYTEKQGYPIIVEHALNDGVEIGRIATNAYPQKIAYSIASQELFIAEYSMIRVVNTTTGKIVRYLSTFPGITGLAADGSIQSWLSVEPAEGIIPRGGSLDVAFTFTSTKVAAGLNIGQYVMTNKEGGKPGPFTIHCSLMVARKSLIHSSKDTVKFIDSWVGETDTIEVILKNQGSSPTVIDNIQIKNSPFSLGVTLPLTIGPYKKTKIAVFFKPKKTGSFSASATIYSNAQNTPKLIIPLRGTAKKAPNAKPNPLSFSFTALPGNVHSKPLTLSNTGELEFPYVVRTRYSMLPHEKPAFSRSNTEIPFYVFDTRGISKIDITTGETSEGPIPLSQDNLYTGGLAFDGKVLYVLMSRFDDTSLSVKTKIHGIDPFDGAVVNTFELVSDNGSAKGLGVSDQYLFTVIQTPPTCYVIDKKNGSVVTSWKINSSINYFFGSLTYCADRKSLFTFERYNNLLVEYDPMTGTVLHSLALQNYDIDLLTYSTQAHALIASKYDGKSVIIDPDNGAIISSFAIQGKSNIFDIAADENGEILRWLTVDSTSNTIHPNGKKLLNVRFDASIISDIGTYYGSVDIYYTGKKRIQPVSIPCTVAVQHAARLIVTPIQLDFGPVNVNTTATSWIELKNPGNAETIISKINSSNPAFTIVSDLPQSISPHQSFLVKVTFKPTKKGAVKGTIDIASNATDGPKSILLSGTGILQSMKKE